MSILKFISLKPELNLNKTAEVVHNKYTRWRGYVYATIARICNPCPHRL
jgi:hypothetical protein